MGWTVRQDQASRVIPREVQKLEIYSLLVGAEVRGWLARRLRHVQDAEAVLNLLAGSQRAAYLHAAPVPGSYSVDRTRR